MIWQRPDGARRMLHWLDGPPLDVEPSTRLDSALLWLDERVPFWDDALMAGVLLALVVVLLVVAGRT